MRSDGNQRTKIHILCGTKRVWRECHPHNHVCKLFICFALLLHPMAVCRYNVYKRVETLLDKLSSNKKISMDATFLPKRKRVLNKKHTRVLNKPVKRAKTKDKEVDAVLDSQVSISCLLHSQESQSSPVSSPVSRTHAHTHTHNFH